MLETDLAVLVPSYVGHAISEWARLGPTRSSAVAHFFEVSLAAIYIDAGIHTDVEVHSDICLSGSLTAVLGTRPRAEPSGTRFDGSVHDGDQSIEKMPTSKKVTYVSVYFVSQGSLLRGFFLCFFDRGCHKTRPSHGCDLSHSTCVLMDHDMGWAEKNDTRRSS